MNEMEKLPEVIEENGKTYRLDPKTQTYTEDITVNYTEEEQELLRTPIGEYGREWQRFMEENYPYEIAPLKMRAQYELIARRVDREAENLYFILSENWVKAHQPRPTDFMECAAWEKMKIMECKQQVMEEVVLKRRGI